MKKWLASLWLMLPLSTYALMCPNSFNQISYGDTIDTVVSICGPANSQYEYTNTVSQSNGTTTTQPNFFWGYAPFNDGGVTQTQQTNAVSHEEHITKLIYNGMQPAALIFVNGQLRDRQMLHQ